MWDGLLVLVVLCIVMAATSFLAGMLPLYFSLSSRQLRLISALGTGVLVGTALIVIIPEGVETLYTASEGGSTNGARSLNAPRTIAARAAFPASLIHDTWRRQEDTALPIDTGLASDGYPSNNDFYVEDATAAQEQEDHSRQVPDDTTSPPTTAPGEDEQAEEASSHHPHTWTGLALITGFILMYLLDTLPSHLSSSSSRPQRFQISLNSLSFNRAQRPSLTPEPPTSTSSSSHASTSRPSSTTTGLVIHACADGIALGASSTTTSRLTFIIFFALIIHKAPAAFGLTSVLLKQGLSKRMARTHLIIFALAAPIGALLTWAAAHLLGYTSSSLSNDMSTEFATGVLLLFSGGTFLYVAVHTMQDHSHEGGKDMQTNGYRGVAMSDMAWEDDGDDLGNGGGSRGGGGGEKKGLTETLTTVGGMLIPLLFSFGHAH